MKKLAIVNNSYKNRIGKRASLVSVIEKIKSSTDADIALTEYAGNAENIARRASDYDIIITAGGDGTISEVVNGMDLKRQIMAIIPLGTGNSLAHNLGINSVTKALGVIKKNEMSKIDLINCRFETDNEKFERYAAATSGLGFASATATFANQYLKMTKAFCYPLSACFKAFNQKVVSAKIQIDDSEFKDMRLTNLFINNAKYAGNVPMFPNADLKDSAFNILLTRTNALTQYLWNIGIITRTYFYYPGERAASRLHIILDKPSPCMLDGEVFNSVKEIIYSIAPGKLRVLA